jgi:hypothetical protein
MRVAVELPAASQTTGRSGLYKTSVRDGFVEAARSLGGHPFAIRVNTN